MNIWQVIFLVAGLGTIGGILNSALMGEFKLPQIDKETKIWRPGWVGNALVGSVAAVIVWGMYGPLASYDVLSGQNQDIHLTVSQLLASILIGIGGGKILTQMADKQSNQIAKYSLNNINSSVTSSLRTVLTSLSSNTEESKP